jgi:ABC-type uncharacterized transport system substrate-binding protein
MVTFGVPGMPFFQDRRVRRGLKTLMSRGNNCAVLFFVACLGNAAAGHPHMFIDVSLKFMLNDSGLAGLYVCWHLDEMNSAWIIEEYDKNKNGVFDAQEQKDVYREAFSNAASENYFMSMSWGLEMMDTVKVERFTASVENKRTVVYCFYVPCYLHSNKIRGKDIFLFFDDPSIYIAFDLKKELIQVSTNDHIEGAISFKKIDYSDAIVLQLRRK